MDQKLQKTHYREYILYSLGFVFLVILYRTAWLSDDAYISYRSIENFVKGYGFTFNPGQRVQAYTHPLWAFLHVPFRFLHANMYHVGLFVSILTSSLAAAFLVIKSSKEPEKRIFLCLAMLSSAAFMDFSTSGLENPLTNLLLILAIAFYLFRKEHPRFLLILSLFAALLLLNRMDSILLFAPVWLLSFWQNKSLKNVGIVLLGLSPFILWEICALIYYGFPFPMTAYAKLNTSLSRPDLLMQGVHYFENLILHDPFTALIICAGLVLPFVYKKREMYPWVVGIGVYLVYILYIGGDFMQGRFFNTPFFLSLIILAQVLQARLALWSAPGIIVLGLLGSYPPIMSHSDLGKGQIKETYIGDHGIANERVFYFPVSGLIAAKGRKLPDGEWVDQGKKIKKVSGKILIAKYQGFLGYFAGPGKHIIDPLALTDPFLAQLPVVYRPDWRPGHHERLVPRGYFPSLSTGENLLVSADLQKVYTAIDKITKGPIWDKERFLTIGKINLTDTYAQLIDKSFYHMPIAASIPENELQKYTKGGLLVHADAGFELKLNPGKTLTMFQIWMQKDCAYTCVFRNGNKIIRGFILQANSPEAGVAQFSLSAPSEQIDNIVLYPNTALHACQVHDIKLHY